MRTVIALFFILSLSSLRAQDSSEDQYRKPFSERLFVGGNVGFNFSNTGSFVSVAPYVGYRVTEEFSIGPGFIYQYNSFRNRATGFKSSYSLYGGNFFARYVFMQYVLLQATYEFINFPTAIYEFRSGLDERSVEQYMYLGGGIQYPLGDNSWLTLLISYDVLHSPTKFNPHGRNPIYVVGFNVGI